LRRENGIREMMLSAEAVSAWVTMKLTSETSDKKAEIQFFGKVLKA